MKEGPDTAVVRLRITSMFVEEGIMSRTANSRVLKDFRLAMNKALLSTLDGKL